MAVSGVLGGVIKRREDPRLITGAGLYTDDVPLDSCLHAVFVRSSIAHARLKSVDFTLAAAMPGVVGIIGAGDLEFAGMTARPRLA
jgi:aerobic carbon-monoxide dehydrogenase large subunit